MIMKRESVALFGERPIAKFTRRNALSPVYGPSGNCLRTKSASGFARYC
jgi:hypothetical protein